MVVELPEIGDETDTRTSLPLSEEEIRKVIEGNTEEDALIAMRNKFPNEKD